MTEEKLRPIHPGEVLLEEFLKPMELSQNRLALSIGVSPRRINEIVLGKRRITADTALRLARYFDMSAQSWPGIELFIVFSICHKDTDFAATVSVDFATGRLAPADQPSLSQVLAEIVCFYSLSTISFSISWISVRRFGRAKSTSGAGTRWCFMSGGICL
jgi:addiction module HigA family antidote